LTSRDKESKVPIQRLARSNNGLEQEVPQESLLVRLNQQMTQEFDKIIFDSRGIKRTMDKLETAEVKGPDC